MTVAGAAAETVDFVATAAPAVDLLFGILGYALPMNDMDVNLTR